MDNKEHLPYIEKYLVPNYYEILKFGGTSVRDEEEEIERMMGYFPGCFTKEQLRENGKRCSIQTIYEDEERGLSMTRQEASELETYIIYLLHRKGAYRSIEEEAFICEMQKWYK